MKLENTGKAKELFEKRDAIRGKILALEQNKRSLMSVGNLRFPFGSISLSADDSVNFELEIACLMIKHALEQKLKEIEKAIGGCDECLLA